MPPYLVPSWLNFSSRGFIIGEFPFKINRNIFVHFVQIILHQSEPRVVFGQAQRGSNVDHVQIHEEGRARGNGHVEDILSCQLLYGMSTDIFPSKRKEQWLAHKQDTNTNKSSHRVRRIEKHTTTARGNRSDIRRNWEAIAQHFPRRNERHAKSSQKLHNIFQADENRELWADQNSIIRIRTYWIVSP